MINEILCGTNRWSIYSLGAKFQKTTSFFSLLDTKSGRGIYVIKKYLKNIDRVGVAFFRCSRLLKMRDVRRYL